MLTRTECWFTESANDHLAKWLADKSGTPIKAFEFGAGCSTVYLSKIEQMRLYSVESDMNWYTAVRNKLIEENTLPKIDLVYFVLYYDFISKFDPDYFDLIIVDGRHRNRCITSSIGRLKPGGVLILDNSERDYYSVGIALMDGWDRKDFIQLQPDKYNFTYPGWTTSFFTKPI